MEDGMEITIDQVHALADSYEKNGLGSSSAGKFLRDLSKSKKLPHGRGITWLQSIFAEGQPESISLILNDLEDLLNRSNRNDTKSTLQSFLNCVKSGSSLTPAQKKLLAALKDQVNACQQDLQLTVKQNSLVVGLMNRKCNMSQRYWNERASTSRRLDSIFHRLIQDKAISPDDFEYVCSNFKGVVEEFENTHHPIGSLRWTKAGEAVMIVGDPFFSQNGTVLIDGFINSKGASQFLSHELFIRLRK